MARKPVLCHALLILSKEMGSHKEGADRRSTGEAVRSPGCIVDFAARVDAKSPIDRRRQIGRRNGRFDGVRAIRIACSKYEAAFAASTCQEYGITVGPMVTATLSIDSRGSSKLARRRGIASRDVRKSLAFRNVVHRA